MLFLYCKEMKLYMSYNICHIDIYIFDYNCDKIKTKITVLNKGFAHLDLLMSHDLKIVNACCVCDLLSLIQRKIQQNKEKSHLA